MQQNSVKQPMVKIDWHLGNCSLLNRWGYTSEGRRRHQTQGEACDTGHIINSHGTTTRNRTSYPTDNSTPLTGDRSTTRNTIYRGYSNPLPLQLPLPLLSQYLLPTPSQLLSPTPLQYTSPSTSPLSYSLLSLLPLPSRHRRRTRCHRHTRCHCHRLPYCRHRHHLRRCPHRHCRPLRSPLRPPLPLSMLNLGLSKPCRLLSAGASPPVCLLFTSWLLHCLLSRASTMHRAAAKLAAATALSRLR
jgi:hypothetical protein